MGCGSITCGSIACGFKVYKSVVCGYIGCGYMVYGYIGCGFRVAFSKGPISIPLGNGVIV